MEVAFTVWLLLLLISSLFLAPISVISLTDYKVAVGDSLSATADHNSSWLSSSGDFAFGFRQLENSENFLLSIWFAKIPDRTIVWYANGDRPAPKGSIVNLTSSSGLVLTTPQGEQLWKSDLTIAGVVAYGYMNDNGNFILEDKKSEKLWETFKNPTGKPKLTVTNWKKGDCLGTGYYGSVYEGSIDGGSFFAVKEVSLHDQGRVSRLEQEIALLSQFQHENIVQYYGSQKDESKLYIFLELADQGDIRKLYQTYPLTDWQVSVYTRQILQGLKYLHDQNVIHRDIKCANILVYANGSVKLADFGLAKAIKTNDIISRQGTANWMAPEVVNHERQGYGLPADIWSLGCTVLEMLTGKVPYSDLEWMAALWKIGNGKPPLVPDSLSREAQDFIRLCLQVKPDNRPTAAQLLKHPFVNKPLPPTSSGSVSPYNRPHQKARGSSGPRIILARPGQSKNPQKSALVGRWRPAKTRPGP